MRSTFLKLFLVPALAVAGALVSQSASAETVNVPFSFTVHGKSFPAGVYTVHQDLNANFVTLRSDDNKLSVTTVLGPGDGDLSDQRVVLRFNTSGNNYVLDSIQLGSRIAGHSPDHKHNHEQSMRTVVGR